MLSSKKCDEMEVEETLFIKQTSKVRLNVFIKYVFVFLLLYIHIYICVIVSYEDLSLYKLTITLVVITYFTYMSYYLIR